MAGEWPSLTVATLQHEGSLLVEDGNHGEYRPRPDEFVDLGVAFIRAADMDSGRVLFNRAARISDKARTRITKGIGRPGDVLLSHKGTVGKVALVPGDAPAFVCSPQTTFWRTLDENRIDRGYLYVFLRSQQFQGQLATRAGETDMAPYVSLTSQRALSVVLPPINEQRAIAHILGTLDDKIEMNRRMNETLEAIARAIFKSWFVDFDPVSAKTSGEPPESICRRLRLTPDLLALFPDRLVDSELGEIPEGWETITLGSIANVIKGKSYRSSELGPSTTALVTLKSFNRGGGYRLDGLKEYTGSFRSEQEVCAGELIVAYTDVTQAADVVGKPALIVSDNRYQHLVISLDVAVIRPERPEYRPFLYGLMSSEAFQQHTRAHTTGTTVLHLAAEAVPGFGFPWPGETLVEAYSALAQPLFGLIDSRVGESRSLGSARDTLLPKLLSGEVRVPLEGAA